MRASEGPTVYDRRDSITDRLSHTHGILCCLDFDGTLAPIVDEPDDATMEPECRRMVSSLAAHPSVDVAVISGRAIDDLRERVDIDGIVYAGNHGLELHRHEQTEVVPEADEQRDATDDICAGIEERTTSIPGCNVEHKGVTATVHYRQVPDERVGEVVEAVEEVVASVDSEFDVLDGKQILEIRPSVDWDKGRVVELLAEDVPADWVPVYVGDDRTDEDAFRVVEPDGLGVVVGDNPATAASVRIPDQSDVAQFLERLESHLDGE